MQWLDLANRVFVGRGLGGFTYGSGAYIAQRSRTIYVYTCLMDLKKGLTLARPSDFHD